MGGIGKTTLARRVYEDPLVISYFDVRAWTTVSQQVNVGRMLHDLLCSIRLPTEMNINQSTDELAHELRQRLMGTRYLIVVDDVWETSLWDFLARCFPKSYGSGVLLTTRLKEIVDYTTSGTNLHNLHFLDSNESWELFCKHIFLKDPLPSKFETIGRNIVDKCQGLPLAIVIAAGLLSQFKNADDLENIREEISSHVSTDLGKQCSRILTISYNHLRPHLKACFLYLGVFYTNSEIPIKKLVRLWIAEGLVKLVRDKKLEEVAVGYLQDLISRSLVQIDKLKSDGQIKTCRMHDLLHGLCVRQATKENLLYVEDNGYRSSKAEHFDMCNNSKKAHGACGCLSFRSSKPKHFDMCNTSKKSRGAFRWPSLRSSKADAFDICNSSKRAQGGFRWLSLRSSKAENFDMCNNSKNPRSVLCLHNDEMPMVNDPKPVNFSLLRVLDLTSPLYTKGLYVSFQDLSDLVLLRYLAFMFDQSLGIEGLKIVLSKNQKLQMLIVSNNAAHWQVNSFVLPSTIWVSPQLRHLEFSNCFRVEPPSMVKENLQSLYWLSIFHCTEEVFSKIPNIKTLGIFCKNPDDGESHNSLESLCHLNQLEVLTIEAEYAIQKCMSLPSIDAFPCNLRKLKLSKTYLPWKDIATIALLPGLEVLKLKMHAFYGSKWEQTEMGFRRLKFLMVESPGLEIWNASDDEFPILENLVLKYCENLERIPSALVYITTLKSIDLEWCHPALLTCAKNIQEEQLDYGNDGLVVLDRSPQHTRKKRMLYNDDLILVTMNL